MSEKIEEKQKKFADKWGASALAMGWTAIPTVLFFLQRDLSVSPLAFNILLHLIAHWWKPYEWPHPSQEAIAKRMNVSVRTIQRGLNELESAKLIERRKTSKDHPKYQGRNIYDLTMLVELLNKVTPEIKEKIKKG